MSHVIADWEKGNIGSGLDVKNNIIEAEGMNSDKAADQGPRIEAEVLPKNSGIKR